jgi:hypothetical protein
MTVTNAYFARNDCVNANAAFINLARKRSSPKVSGSARTQPFIRRFPENIGITPGISSAESA